MIKKTLFIIFFITCLIIFNNCKYFAKKLFGTDTQTNYEITDIILTNTIFDTQNFYIVTEILDTNYVIDTLKLYGFNLDVVSNDVETFDLSEFKNNISIINSAYATSPTWDYYKLINGIDSVNIITLNNFDHSKLCGSKINDYFSFYDVMDYYGSPWKNADYQLTDLIKYYENLRMKKFFIDFRLEIEPTIDSILQFQVDVYFKDLTVMTKKTIPIIKKLRLTRAQT